MKEIVANMAGTIADLLVDVDDKVGPGQDVVILESMKMQIPIQADDGGVVKEIKKRIGDFTNEGEVILILE